ncbi:cation:proton antiporter [Amycolatopsis thailandensis]|uniref:cation:proton antiporter n=1 Tax=Amycolatopsis thailandensis TaxID=589330 RepID=UPI00142E26F3|nr:cation:proton antiporter [Amycolatopsis thailandensis]
MTAPVGQFFFSLAVIIIAARIGGVLAKRLGQPPVVGEIVVGIALGPSLLGLVAPGLAASVVPAAVAPMIQSVAQLGLVVFMLLVGLEIDTTAHRGNTVLVASAGLGAALVPFGLGALLSLLLSARYPADVSAAAFTLFCGVALSVTAFPVLSRIVEERGLTGTPLGTVAVSAAAVIDLIAWAALSVVTGLAASGHGAGWLPVLGVGFALLMLLGVRPLLARAARSGLVARCSSPTLLASALAAAALAAWFTESIGLHIMFGPFLVGLVIPRTGDTARFLTDRLGDVCGRLLLPAFFVVGGLGVHLEALTVSDAAVLGLVVLLAVAGKVAGGAVPARLAGWDGRTATRLGVLLSTRGLTELVVLSIGLAEGILTHRLYTIFVVTAIVTTVITSPLLTALERKPGRGRRPEETMACTERN